MTIVQVDSSRGDSSIYGHLALLAALVIGIGAQIALAQSAVLFGVVPYLIAIILTAAGMALGTSSSSQNDVVMVPAGVRGTLPQWRTILTTIAIVASIATFALSGGNRYRVEGV